MTNEELVERITREVVRELERQTFSAPDNQVSLPLSGKKLIVAGSKSGNTLRSLAGQGHSVVCSSGLENEARSLGFADINTGTGVWDYTSILAGISEVIVPEISIALLSKIAHVVADTPASGVVISALEQNIPVTATIGAQSGPLAGQLEELKSKAASVGIRFLSSGSVPTTGGNASAFISYCGIDDGGAEVCGYCLVDDKDRIQQFIDEGASRFTTQLGEPAPPPGMSKYIDHTLLKPETTRSEIEVLCAEAKEFNFASVCVNPFWVPLCAELLKGTTVKVCTVIGFPLGATSTASKVAETKDAITNGATEIDMVLNVGALKAGENDLVRNDIAAVKQACGSIILKVIFETGLLTDEEKMTASQLCKDANADFVKTSTGFGPGGATLTDIALMRRVVGPDMGVKASGGVRDRKTAEQMIEMGATRIGASAGIAIVKGDKATGSGY